MIKAILAALALVLRLAVAPAPIPQHIVAPQAQAPTTPTVGLQLTEEQMTGLIADYFPEEWRSWALNVSKCESNWYTAAANPTSSAAGLFQFLHGTWDWVSEETGAPPYDYGGVWEVNWQMINAAWLVQHAGPSQWECKG